MKRIFFLLIATILTCATVNAQKVLFTDNFGAYPDDESLSTNGSGWAHEGVGDFTNNINATYGALSSNCFGQLLTTGAAEAYQEMDLLAGHTYEFKAWLKTTNNRIYSTIRIEVGGVDEVTSGFVAENFQWEELSISYTPTVDETARFKIIKTQAQVLNIDRVRITCASCVECGDHLVYDFHDSKEGWISGGNSSLALGNDGLVVNAFSNQPKGVSGNLAQDLGLNTDDFNMVKITFLTPYEAAGEGLGKIYFYDTADNIQFATFDFARDATNTTSYQTATIDLSTVPFGGSYPANGYIARVGFRAPWGIANGDVFHVQYLEFYKECSCAAGDIDNDSICDDLDDCVGTYDDCGLCNGPGVPIGDCDCNGNQLDALGVCGGSCDSDVNGNGICDDVDPALLYCGSGTVWDDTTGQCVPVVDDCPYDLDDNLEISTADLLNFLTVFGSQCP